MDCINKIDCIIWKIWAAAWRPSFQWMKQFEHFILIFFRGCNVPATTDVQPNTPSNPKSYTKTPNTKHKMLRVYSSYPQIISQQGWRTYNMVATSNNSERMQCNGISKLKILRKKNNLIFPPFLFEKFLLGQMVEICLEQTSWWTRGKNL